MHAEHPHNFVINYVRLLGGDLDFIQLAWNILNDRRVFGSIRKRVRDVCQWKFCRNDGLERDAGVQS